MTRQKLASVATVCATSLMLLLTGPALGQTSKAGKTTDGYCGSRFTEPFVPEQTFGCKMPALQTSPTQNSALLELKRGASQQEITQAMQAWRNRPTASPLLLKNLNNTTGNAQ